VQELDAVPRSSIARSIGFSEEQTLAAQDAVLTAAGAAKVYAEKVSGASTDGRKALAQDLRTLREGDEPIPLPDGGELRMLLDAGRYIEALPNAKHDRPEWQTAIRFLLMAVEGRLPVMFVHIALLKALNAGKPKPAPAPRKKAAKKYRMLR
jgi:hypothetical protein